MENDIQEKINEYKSELNNIKNKKKIIKSLNKQIGLYSLMIIVLFIICMFGLNALINGMISSLAIIITSITFIGIDLDVIRKSFLEKSIGEKYIENIDEEKIQEVIDKLSLSVELENKEENMNSREEMLETEIEKNNKRVGEIEVLLDSKKISNRDIANIGLGVLAICGVLAFNGTVSSPFLSVLVDVLTIPSIAFIVCKYTDIFKKDKKQEKKELLSELDYLMQEIKDNTKELNVIKENKYNENISYSEVSNNINNNTYQEVNNVNGFSRKKVLNNDKNNNI